MPESNVALAWEFSAVHTGSTNLTRTSRNFLEKPGPSRVPTLRVIPLLGNPQPRRFVRVPTHVVGVHTEHRESPRASLKLPLQLRSINGLLEEYPVTLVTRDISSSGVYFLCPRRMLAGAEIELDIVLVSRPLGYGNVVVSSRACVRRIELANVPGWFGIAVSFTDFVFDRDDRIPNQFSAD